MEKLLNAISIISLIYVALPLIFLLALGIYLSIGKKISSSGVDKVIEISKWYIISVALVYSGNLIKDGFTERETGMKEMQVYDKYVELILEADNIEKRWKLAQYFATVTPTDRLRERWIEYQGKLQNDYDKYKDILEKERQLELADSINISPETELEKIKQQKVSFETPLISKGIINFRIDIFYLEETMISNNSRAKANNLAFQLASTGYEIKVKKLSTSKNAEVGYRIYQNEIRSEQSELDVAKGINSLLGENFEIRTITYRTPQYLSVFVYD